MRREREKGVSTAWKALGYVAVVAVGNQRMRCKEVQSQPFPSNAKKWKNMFTSDTNYIRNQIFEEELGQEKAMTMTFENGILEFLCILLHDYIARLIGFANYNRFITDVANGQNFTSILIL